MFQDVVVAIDGSPASFRAAALGAQLAAAKGGVVDLVAVASAPSDLASRLGLGGRDPAAERERRAADLRSAAILIGETTLVRDARVLEGPVAEAILSLCGDEGSGKLISVGSGKHRLRLGSVSSAVLRNSTCPVLVVREGASRGPRLQKIQVGFDATDGARDAVRVAADVAAHSGGEVDLVWVLRPSFPLPPQGLPLTTAEMQDMAGEPERSELAEAARLVRDAGAKVGRTIFELGRPPERLLARAEEGGVDLVIIGAHGHRGPARRILGGVSDQLVASSLRPVLVIK